MRNFLMSASETQDSPMFELFKSDVDLGTALLYAVIGIAVVICVLLILIGLLTVFEKIFAAVGKSSAKKAENNVAASETAAENSDDEEVVAAITAAIALVYAEESGGGETPAPFKIRRIRQVNKFNANR